MKKFLLAFSALVMLSISSCKKDKDKEDENKPITKEALAGDYKLWYFKFKPTSGSEQDYLTECKKDDVFKLKSDFTTTTTDAGTTCSPSGSGTGTWGLPGSNKITIDGEEWTISKWNGKELHMSISGPAGVATLKYSRL